MRRINFMFCIHNHQPIGNFEHVLEKAYIRCYLPFLEMLEKFPTVRLSMHYSGVLYEWFLEKRPEFMDRLTKLVKKGQVEILGGGFYEPIPSMITSSDFKDQIDIMTDFCKKWFGFEPRGMWTAERVWIPELPKLVSGTSITYTLLDDNHFRYAGLRKEDLCGYYVTEKEGHTLALFPIDKVLRYYIPFEAPEKTIEYLHYHLSENDAFGITYGDDGEKFGIWPGTYNWVYEEKWLERFFSLLEENSDWIRMITFSEYMERFSAMGRIYLPTASYDEMLEWALPPSSTREFQRIKENLKKEGKLEEYLPYLRGGIWENFLVKYEEANMMQKRMLYVSKMTKDALRFEKNPEIPTYRRAILKAQCNCAFWHGLFGGLYLNYLRDAIYREVIKAQVGAERVLGKNSVSLEFVDIDRDLKEEAILNSEKIFIGVDPSYGGSVFEISYKPKFFNVTNILTRREEAYHNKIKEVVNIKEHRDRPISIHNIIRSKEEDLEDFLFYDWYTRRSFLDHFFDEHANLENFRRCQYPELGDFVNQPYEVESYTENEKEVSLTIKREGHLWRKDGKFGITVKKSFILGKDDNHFVVDYLIENRSNSDLHIWYGLELNLTLLAGCDPKRVYEVPNIELSEPFLNSIGVVEDISDVHLLDYFQGLKISLSVEPRASFWRFPVETISNSESGFERTYQGSVVLFNWKMKMESKEVRKIRLKFCFEQF